jgi:hypothetical protein
MDMPTELLLISRYPTKPGAASSLAAVLKPTVDGRTLVALDADEVVTLEQLDAAEALDALRERLGPVAADFAHHLSGDIRREILDFVEAPKTGGSMLPDTPYIQLRHVEVNPDEHAAYLIWRDETIFEVVRNADAVESFVAFHSVVSGQPGVMFVSGFSVDPPTYSAVFSSERYSTIVQQAGDRFITGGTSGLYTKIYAETTRLAA